MGEHNSNGWNLGSFQGWIPLMKANVTAREKTFLCRQQGTPKRAGKLPALFGCHCSGVRRLVLRLHAVQPLAGRAQVIEYFGVEGGELGVKISC